MNLWPTRRQWRGWSLPAKLTAVGALIGAISVLLAVTFGIISLSPSRSADESLDRALEALATQDGQLNNLSDKVEHIRRDIELSQEDSEGLREELTQQLAALDATVRETISAIRRERGTLNLDESHLDRSDEAARGIGEALKRASEAAGNRNDEDSLMEATAEVEKLRADLGAARRYVASGDIDALRVLLGPLQTEQFRTGVIRSETGTEVYGPGEGREFLDAVEAEAAGGSVQRLIRGTWTASGDCRGLPDDCGELDVQAEAPNGSSARIEIQWYIGPRDPVAEERIAQLQSAGQLRLCPIASRQTACQWYASRAGSRWPRGSFASPTYLSVLGRRSFLATTTANGSVFTSALNRRPVG